MKLVEGKRWNWCSKQSVKAFTCYNWRRIRTVMTPSSSGHPSRGTMLRLEKALASSDSLKLVVRGMEENPATVVIEMEVNIGPPMTAHE